MRLSALLCMLIVWLAGCTSPPTYVVQTDGFHASSIDVVGLRYTDAQGRPRVKVKKLDPVPAMFTALWEWKGAGYHYAGEEEARDAAVEWLTHVGVVPIVPRDVRHELLDEQRFRLLQDDDKLRLGRMQGVQWIIDVRVRGAVLEQPAVTIRATSVETGEIVWSGSARSQRSMREDHPSSACIRLLVDQALATAFGFLQPGRQVGGCQ